MPVAFDTRLQRSCAYPVQSLLPFYDALIEIVDRRGYKEYSEG